MQKIHAKHALTEEGWRSDVTVSIADGRIQAVTGAQPADGHRVDLLLPAPVNLHSHAFQRAMAGLTEKRGPNPRDSFWTWRALMYRFLDRLDPDQVEAIAALVFMEMLEAGYGAVAEFHYLHHDVGGQPYVRLSEMAERLVAAAQTAGIGLTLLPVLYTVGGCDGRALDGGQRRFGNDLERYLELHAASQVTLQDGFDDHVLGAAAHSLRAVSPADLKALHDAVPEGPLHMHLAEQVAEVEEVQSAFGARPVDWVLDNLSVDERWCLIHCTQMTDTETRRLAQTGAVAGLCPITEASLGDGIFNAVAFQSADGRYGVGSDSNIHIALWEELASLEYGQRLRDRSRAALATDTQSTGRRMFEAACQAGAQAAGRPTGRLAVGQMADLIGVSTDTVYLCNRRDDALLDSLIFGGRGRDCVTDVWSAGRHVVTEGRHIHRDAIVSTYRAALNRLGEAL